MTTSRILVTPRSLTAAGNLEAVPELRPLYEAGFELVAGPAGVAPSEDQLAEIFGSDGNRIVGWLAGVERVSERVLDAAHDLTVIARNGTGADAIDQSAAAERDIAVLTAPGANSQGVAELALTLGLAALRDIVRGDRSVRAGGWHRSRGRELGSIRVGVVGYGAIGRRVAGFFSAVGARVSVFDPYADGTLEHERVETLDELLTVSDLVSLHTPPRADGTPVVGARELSRMPHGAILINTARSSLVAADKVADALEDGRLAVYAADAFDAEPPPLDRLLTHERTILTSHIGGFTDESVRRATEAAVTNLLKSFTNAGDSEERT